MAAFNCRHRGGAPAPGAINHQLIWRQPPPPATPIPAAKPRRSRRDSAAIAPVTKPAELMTARQPLSVVVATLTLHGPASAWGRAPPPAPEAHSLPGGARRWRRVGTTPRRRRGAGFMKFVTATKGCHSMGRSVTGGRGQQLEPPETGRQECRLRRLFIRRGMPHTWRRAAGRCQSPIGSDTGDHSSRAPSPARGGSPRLRRGRGRLR